MKTSNATKIKETMKEKEGIKREDSHREEGTVPLVVALEEPAEVAPREEAASEVVIVEGISEEKIEEAASEEEREGASEEEIEEASEEGIVIEEKIEVVIEEDSEEVPKEEGIEMTLSVGEIPVVAGVATEETLMGQRDSKRSDISLIINKLLICVAF